MAERIAYLEAIVGADITQFRKGMRDIRNEVGFLSETMKGMSAIGRTMTFTLTAPLAALASYAVDAASSFDASMRNINSIAQLGEEQFKALKDQVFEFASTTRAGIVPATDALYEIFSAGITDTARAMAVWETSTRVAEAGLASLEKTTNAVTATMSAYGYETDQATRVGDVWTHMVALGVGSLEEFLGNAQKMLPLANALGVSFEDLGASTAFISQLGGGAKKAETAVAMMMSNLLKPAATLEAAYAKLGVTTGQELIQKFGSLGEAILAIKGVAGDEVDFAKMFSKTGLEAAYAFTNNVDMARESIAHFIATVEGATGRAWEEQMKSFEAQMDLFKTSVQAAATVIGEVLLPIITPIIQKATEWMISMSQLNPQLLELGVVVGAVVAAAGPLLWILGSLLSPIGLLIAGVAGLAYVVSTNFAAIETSVKSAVTGILGADGVGKLESLWDTVEAILFPPESAPAIIGDIIVPVFAKASDFVTVEAGDTLWDIFKEQYADQMTWEAFRDNVILPNGRTPATLQIGDLIEVPTTLGDQLNDMIITGFRHSATGIDIPLVALTGGGMDTIKPLDNRNPLVTNVIDRLKAAATEIMTQVPAIMIEAFAGLPVSIMEALNGAVAQVTPDAIYDPLSGQLVPQTTGTTELFQGIRDWIQGSLTQLLTVWESVKGAFADLGTGIAGFVAGLETVNTANAQKAVGDLLTIGGILAVFLGGVLAFGVNTIGNIAKNVLPQLGSGIAGLVNTVGSLAAGDFEGVVKGVDQATRGLVGALLGFPAGIADSVIQFLRDSTNVQMDASTADTFTTWAGIINNAATIVATAWEGMQHRIKLAWLQIQLDANVAVQGLLAGLAPLFDAAGLGGALELKSIELGFSEMDIRAQLAEMQIGDVITSEINRQVASSTTSPLMENLNIDTAQGSFGIAGGSFIDQVVGWVNTSELSDTQQATVANWFNRSISGAIASGDNALFSSLNEAKGELDPAAIDMSLMSNGIIDGMVNGLLAGQPRINTAMTDMADGANTAAKIAWGISSPSEVFKGYGANLADGLILGVKGKATEVQSAFDAQFGAKGTILKTMGIFQSSFGKIVSAIVGEIGEIKSAAIGAAGAINSLGANTGGGGGEANGQPRAAGGAGKAGNPYWVGDGVGRELFIPDVNGQIVPEHKLRSEDGGGGGGGGNTIHIYGVQDVDKMLYELKRRGVVLK